MSDDVDASRFTRTATGLFGVIFVLIGWDMASDYAEGTNWVHLSTEFAILLAAAIGVALLWRRSGMAWLTVRSLELDLASAKEEAQRWRAESFELIKGLGVAIEQQFSRWSLTRAEADVGLLLLKGLSHKEISNVRQTSERTVREQARALYKKANLSGRSSLSAFFLEDLLLPHEVE